MKDVNSENTHVISTREKFCYGLTDFADTAIFTALSSYIVIFWTDVVGIAAATTGTIILISKIWDGINDPLMGHIVDKTDTKYGKARPYFKWMPYPFAISAILVFTAPDLGPTATVLYALFTYVLVTSMYTTLNIPLGVLGAKMTDNQVERSRLNVWRNAFGQVGGIVTSSLMLPVAIVLGNGDYKIGAPLAMASFLVIALIIYRITYSNCKERVGSEKTSSDGADENIAFLPGLKVLLKNRAWKISFLTQSSAWIGQGASNSAMAFYAIYVLGKPALIPVFLTITPLFNLLGMLLFTSRFTMKFGKVKTMMMCSIGAGTLLLLLFTIPDSNIYAIILIFAISQFCAGPNKSLIFAMFADSIEYGEYKTGIRLEGLTYAGGTMGSKAGAGLAGVIVGFVLSATGYVPDAVQTPGVILGIKSLVFLLPALSFFFIAFLMSINDLDKVYPIALDAIKEKRAKYAK